MFAHAKCAVASLFLILAGCSGSKLTDTGDTADTGSFVATVDGLPWTTNSGHRSAGVATNGTYTISGTNGDSSSSLNISLVLKSIRSTGTYTLGVGTNVTGGSVTMRSGASTWSTPLSGAAGTVTVLTLTPTRIAGTFSFSALPAIAASGAKTVTSGAFDLPITGSTTVNIPEASGGFVSGSVGGTAWNAASVSWISLPGSGALAAEWRNTAYKVNVVASAFTGEGTYVLGTNAARYFLVTDLANSGQVWGGIDLSSGSFVVTSYTSSRIKGTFDVVLQPSPLGSARSPLRVVGSFDTTASY